MAMCDRMGLFMSYTIKIQTGHIIHMQWQHSKHTGNKKIHTGNRKMKSNTYSLPSGNFLNIQETRKHIQETEYSCRKQENEILAYSLTYTGNSRLRQCPCESSYIL